VSLRTNAERLLRDVQAAHQRLTAGLDEISPDDAPAPGQRPATIGSARREGIATPGGGELEVPEFLPRR
jgi:hypothetical protein